MILTGTRARLLTAVAAGCGMAVSAGSSSGGVELSATSAAAWVFSGVANMFQKLSVAVIATAVIAICISFQLFPCGLFAIELFLEKSFS
jgi:hypothetical protein